VVKKKKKKKKKNQLSNIQAKASPQHKERGGNTKNGGTEGKSKTLAKNKGRGVGGWTEKKNNRRILRGARCGGGGLSTQNAQWGKTRGGVWGGGGGGGAVGG